MMISLYITPLCAAILGTLQIILALRVIALRGNPIFKFLKFGKGDSEDSGALKRAVRGHGNLTENTPIFLMLLLFAELAGVELLSLYLWAGLFVLGRFVHGIMFCFCQHVMVMRVLGMVATFTPQGALIVENILHLPS